MEFPSFRYPLLIPKIHKLLLPIHDNPLIHPNNFSIKFYNGYRPYGICNLCVTYPRSL